MRKSSPYLALASLIVVAILVIFAVRAAKSDAAKESAAEAVIAQDRAEERALIAAEQNIRTLDEWSAAMKHRTDRLQKMQDELRAAEDRGAGATELAQRQLNVSLNELALKQLEVMRP